MDVLQMLNTHNRCLCEEALRKSNEKNNHDFATTKENRKNWDHTQVEEVSFIKVCGVF